MIFFYRNYAKQETNSINFIIIKFIMGVARKILWALILRGQDVSHAENKESSSCYQSSGYIFP